MSETDDDRAQQLVSIDDIADERLRHVKHDGRWFFSIIDIIGLLTDLTTPIPPGTFEWFCWSSHGYLTGPYNGCEILTRAPAK